jgi:hypothetical protein
VPKPPLRRRGGVSLYGSGWVGSLGPERTANGEREM